MQRINLTVFMIESAKPKNKLYALKDSRVPGLQLVVNPSGIKTYFVRIGLHKEKIGNHPFITLKEARRQAIDKIRAFTFGEPFHKKRKTHEQTNSITLDLLVTEYLQSRSVGNNILAQKTIKTYDDSWQLYGKKSLGDIQISELQDKDVNILYHSLNHAPSNIKSLTQLIVPAFKYGKSMGYPVATLDPDSWLKFKVGRKDRYFKPREFKTLMSLLERNFRSDSSKMQALVIQFLMYTGCRCGEILKMKWSNVSFEDGCITIPKQDTKTNKKRIIPITPVIAELFSNIPGNKREIYVFSSERAATGHVPYPSIEHFWKLLMAEGKFNVNKDDEPLTMHSMRHTFATAANSINVSAYTLKALIGHSKGTVRDDTTELYTHCSNAVLAKAQAAIISALQSGTY